MIADIGNGTMNTLYMVNGIPQSANKFTDKFGTHQCTLAVREEFQQKTNRELNDLIIEEVLRTGTADIPASDLKIIREELEDVSLTPTTSSALSSPEDIILSAEEQEENDRSVLEDLEMFG